MHTKEYRETKFHLQVELSVCQRQIKKQKSRYIIIFEGRDSAGKTGTIKRFMQHLNTRYARIVALDKPTEQEQSDWYWRRYVDQFPREGEITFWDRSWYNRPGIETVMGFCTPEQTEQFYKDCVLLEESWIKSGINIIKIFLDIGQKEQLRRLHKRYQAPLKNLTNTDLEGYVNWDSYTRVLNEMVSKTSTDICPWIVIDANDKRRARLEAMQYVVEILQKSINRNN